MHPQLAIDHRQRIVAAPHLAGAHRMEDGRADIAGGARQFFLAAKLRAGLQFLRLHIFCSAGAATILRVNVSELAAIFRSSSVLR